MPSITQNNVLSKPMALSSGHKATATRMLLVKKFNSYGAVERYKARLVYSHLWFRDDIDWGQQFAPVVDKVSVRLFWSFCATNDFDIM